MSANTTQTAHPDRTSATSPRGRKSKPFLPIAFALRRAPLVLILGAVLSFFLSFLILPRVQPIYQTEGRILIDPSREITLEGRERNPIPGSLRDYTRTLTSRALTPDVLRKAVSRLDPEEYPSFMNPAWSVERNAARLGSRIRVQAISSTYLISVTITADQPQGLAPALNQVMYAFIEKTELEQQQRQERRLAYLTLEQEKILERVAEIQSQLHDPESVPKEKTFVQANFNLQVGQLGRLKDLYLSAITDLSQAEAELQLALEREEMITAINLQPFADELIFNNHSINLMEHSTYNQLQDLRSSIDGLAPTNPERRNIEERMRLINDYLENHKQRASVEIIRQLNEKRKYELELDVVKSRSSVNAAQQHFDFVGGLLAEATSTVVEAAQDVASTQEVEFILDHLRERIAALGKRIDDAEMEAKAPVLLSVDKLASAPGGAARTNAQTLLLMTLALGFGSVGSFILAFDFLDNRIRDASELEQALGATSPQPIPSLLGLTALPATFAEATLEIPRHKALYSLRALAVRMETEHERFGAQVFCLIGLNPKCGVTALTLNLAHILRTRDRKILIIECNTLRPGVANAHGGLRKHPGLSELLDGTIDDWTQTVQPDPRRQVDVITAGQPGVGIPDRTALLPLLAQVRQHYNVILLDNAPILEDEFAHSVALHADATLIIAREDVSLYRDLRRSLDILLDAQIPALSAVLNLSQPKRGARIASILQKEMLLLSRLHTGVHKFVKRILRNLALRGR